MAHLKKSKKQLLQQKNKETIQSNNFEIGRRNKKVIQQDCNFDKAWSAGQLKFNFFYVIKMTLGHST